MDNTFPICFIGGFIGFFFGIKVVLFLGGIFVFLVIYSDYLRDKKNKIAMEKYDKEWEQHWNKIKKYTGVKL